MPLDEYREANRANWDDRVPIHLASDAYDAYDISNFVKNEDSLNPVIGSDREMFRMRGLSSV